MTLFKKSKPQKVEEVVKVDEKVLGVTGCAVCGKPSTITSPDGKVFCSLACKSVSEMR